MLFKLAKWGGLAVGGLLGLKTLGKAFGTDPDFTNAWMINTMTGRGGFLKTMFADGLGKMMFGSRTMSAMMNSGMGMGMMGMGMPFGSALYGNPMMMGMNPYMMNPMAMGSLAYNPMMMGSMLWR